MPFPSRPVTLALGSLAIAALTPSCSSGTITFSAAGTTGAGGAPSSSATTGSMTTSSSTTSSASSGTGGAATTSSSSGTGGTGGAPPPVTVRVLTNHNDNARTGANLQETVLDTSNVEVSKFGMIFARPVDDQIFAQPLYVPGVTVPGKGKHNVVYVATMNDSVYAFDADDPTAGAPLWTVSFLDGAGVTPVDHTDVGWNCGTYEDIGGNIGILSTPVIDEASATIYVVAKTKENGTDQVYRLHALDLTTGAEKPNSPVILQASVAGTGVGSTSGVIPFDPVVQNQRSALTLANGRIYISFASYCDTGNYHGWILAYDAATLQQNAVYIDTPDGSEGGIWMAGQGISVDANGTLFLLTGNGTFETTGKNLGSSIVKLTPALSVLDWFTPYNIDALNAGDLDLGSSGALLVPGTNLLVGGGKGGYLYVVDQTNLGKWNMSGDTQILQSFQVTNAHIHGSPVVWSPPSGDLIYVWGEYGHLNSYQRNGTQFAQVGQSTLPAPDGMPGGMLSISANGTTPGTGIVWATHPFVGDANQAVRPGILQAFDATDVTTPLWDSQENPTRDDFGNFAKFCPPTIANGKVYLATFSNQLAVYGLSDFSGPCYNGIQDPGEQGVDCGGTCAPCVLKTTTCPTPDAMNPGDIFDCDLGSTRQITATGISVGCNDGETGVFTVTFDQPPVITTPGNCNTNVPLTNVASRLAHLKMISGGGSDDHISLSAWTVTHY